MSSSINIAATLIADLMGVLLLICVAAGNRYVSKEQFKRNIHLVVLYGVTMFSCTMDIVSAFADGNDPILSFVSGTLLFFCGPITAVAWIGLIAKHIKIRLSKIHKMIICIFFSIAMGLIIVNIFTPVLFIINENDIYQRVDGLYIIYAFSYFGLIFDAIGMYLVKKHESGGLKFFPMWGFVIPIAIGMVIQNMFFGVSTIAPFMTISITLMINSFQNQMIFRDQLTDLYNRYYLSLLEKKFSGKSSREYSVLMLDINDFKSINDLYGHDAGDDALVNLSKVLVSVVDKDGEIIRYAGDEFIIILNSHEEKVIEALINRIHQTLKDFSDSKTTPYELSVSVGWCRFSFGGKSLNEYINEADKRMYTNKQAHYKVYPKLDCK